VLILLIDDHAVLTEGLTFVLSSLDESLEFLEATTCEAALEYRDGDDVDLILLDYHLRVPGSGPVLDGLEALAAVREAFASVTVVMLSGEYNPEIIRASIDAGASGFITKSSKGKILVAALRLILEGGIYLPPEALLGDSSGHVSYSPHDRTLPGVQIKGQPREVLMRVIQGKANKVVAREMGISEATVKAHLSSAFRTLRVKNRTEAVFVAAKLGLASSVVEEGE